MSTYEPQRGEEPVALSLIQTLMEEGNLQKRSHQADLNSVLVDVSHLSPLDLSVLKENWVSALTVKEIKELPFSNQILEDFIVFRDRNKKEMKKM